MRRKQKNKKKKIDLWADTYVTSCVPENSVKMAVATSYANSFTSF